jgi:DNA-binding NarL/FixJ family response regulator
LGCVIGVEEALVATIRIVLADDHRELLDSVRQLLGNEYLVLVAVHDGREAVEAVRKLDPDILITDVSMPSMSGFDAASYLRLSGSRTRVVFLTIHEDSDYVAKAFSVGASGYVSKRHLTADLPAALREVMRGHNYVSPSIDVPAPIA